MSLRSQPPNMVAVDGIEEGRLVMALNITMRIFHLEVGHPFFERTNLLIDTRPQ